MAAATAFTTTSKVSDWGSAVRAYFHGFIEHGNLAGLMVPINDKAIVPSTSVDDVADILLLSQKLPPHSYVHAFRGTPSDLDTNVSPALVYSVIAVDADGNTLATFVSGSTAGQAGAASDSLLAAKVGSYVGSKEWYLAIKITTAAATAAAGTYKWHLFISQGTMSALQSPQGPYLGNAEA